MLIREGRGYRERDEQSKEAIAQPWAWILASPPGTHMTKQRLRVTLQILKPPPRGRSQPYGAHNHIGPRTPEPEVGDADSPLTSRPSNQKSIRELLTPCLNHYQKTPHCPLKGEHSFEGVILLWPPLSGKAIKLFFSMIPKTLTLRFNSA